MLAKGSARPGGFVSPIGIVAHVASSVGLPKSLACRRSAFAVSTPSWSIWTLAERFATDRPNASIRQKGADDFDRVVARSVVDEEAFPIGKRLALDRTEGIGQILTVIAGGDTDAHRGIHWASDLKCSPATFEMQKRYFPDAS